MMMAVAETNADVDERRRAETWRNNHGSGNTDWLRVNHDRCRLRVIVNRSRLSDDHRRGSRHIDDLRRSRNVNRGGVQDVTEDLNGGDSGEDFADRGPFTVSGGGSWNTGSNKSGEA